MKTLFNHFLNENLKRADNELFSFSLWNLANS